MRGGDSVERVPRILAQPRAYCALNADGRQTGRYRLHQTLRAKLSDLGNLSVAQH